MLNKTLKFVKKRKWTVGIIGLVIVLGLVYFFVIKKPVQAETITVQKGDFLQQVSVSGNVKAAQNIDLSFEAPGTVTSVRAVVGDKVYAGKFLAGQGTAQLSAQLSEMQANIDVQKARLAQLMAGAAPENIIAAKTAVTNAKQSLAASIQDAYTKVTDAIFNKADEMFYNPQSANPQIAFSTTNSELKNSITLQRTSVGDTLKTWAVALLSLDASSDMTVITATTKANLTQAKSFLDALSVIVNDPNSCAMNQSSQCTAISSTWKSDLLTARTNLNTVMSTIIAGDSAVKAAQDQLAVAGAPARQTDVAVYQAQIAQAQAQAQGVLAQIREKQIFAPISGTITTVNAKVGMIMGNSPVAISMISNGSFQIESYLPEIYVALVKVGNDADVTLDAYGPNKTFHAKVVSIDPSETVKDGVSTYKVIMNLDNSADQVRDGMTANVIITTEKKSDVISVPQGAIASVNGKQTVKVQVGKDVVVKEVTVGDVSSNGQAEILSGLSAGDQVVVK